MAACKQSERRNFHIYDHDYGNVQMINKKICMREGEVFEVVKQQALFRDSNVDKDAD